jgi:hypothetical protein
VHISTLGSAPRPRARCGRFTDPPTSSIFKASTAVKADIDSFLDLQDHELALWGVVPRSHSIASNLVIRGASLGFVRVARLQKRSPEIRIAIRLTRGAELTCGDEALQKFEATVVSGVRKCLWGDCTWPKHTIEFSYNVQTQEHW